MAELTFRSAGVSAREIDLSGPANVEPVGTPAGIIGTSIKGPAFVPVTLGTFQDFVAKFGETDGEKFGPLAVNEWLKNAQSVTYLRVLGAGDGAKRTTTGDNTGKVTKAGFVVGAQQPRDSGLLGANSYAVAGGVSGRTHILGCFMSESAGSDIFSSAGIQTNASASAIIRGVLFAADGVVPMLSSSWTPLSGPPLGATPSTTAGPNGALTGTVDISLGRQQFVMLLNGHIPTPQYPSVITASFDVEASNYFPTVFNTDPLLVEKTGHVLYTHYDIHPALAVVTGTDLFSSAANFVTDTEMAGKEPIAFLTTGSRDRNVGSTSVPNFENFENRFKTPFSPFVISQKFGGAPKDLFRIHSLDDGAYSNTKFKVSIKNIAKSNSERDQFGRFDIAVREFSDTDDNPIVIESFFGLSLDPGSDRYIAKVIGDQHLYFDFDKGADGQKLVLNGNFPNVSSLIRVEMASSVDNSEIDATALPVGFRGHNHLVTSGSSILADVQKILPAGGTWADAVDIAGVYLNGATVPPVPFRESVSLGVDPKVSVNKNLYWGVQFTRKNSVTEPNNTLVANTSIESLTKYFPDFQTTWQNPWVGNNNGTPDSDSTVYDSDRFNNNKFSLENIEIKTGSNGIVDPKEWASARYKRAGNITPDDDNKTRAFSVETDFSDLTAKSFAKFTFFVQGGFDGTRIFDANASKLTNASIVQEMNDPARGQDQAAGVKTYIKALEIMGEKSEVDVKLLAIPGIRHSIITNQAIDTTEQRFDAMLILDLEERDTLNSVVTSSIQEIHVGNTAAAFANRNLDTSFAATYFPDQIVTDPFTKTNVRVPPSVVALGAFALNDAVAHPWFAPAGFVRGALNSSLETAVRLNRANLDTLYDVDINPITSFPGTGGPVIWGQKTLSAVQSSLDRVNVRRLLIEIRRQVKVIANRIVFEPNRESTLAKFEGLVRPKLQRIQELQGVDRFKVIIDTTTTTQADVDNNTVRGQIFVQPTRVAEFISLDFVVSNAGADI
jgi:phage tail sheath protein FI